MMREELQAYLDGELSFEELPADLKSRAAAWDAFLEEAREQGPAGAPTGLEESVMARIRGESPERGAAWRRALDWATRPRTVKVSPAAAGLAAAAMVLLLLLPGGLREQAPERASPQAQRVQQAQVERTGQARIYVQFTLEAPEASSVAVAGDFNGWEAEYMLSDADGDGVWTGRVPVGPGVHEYMFVVDGSEWMTDPQADRYTDDGFGNRNAVLAVTPPSQT